MQNKPPSLTISVNAWNGREVERVFQRHFEYLSAQQIHSNLVSLAQECAEFSRRPVTGAMDGETGRKLAQLLVEQTGLLRKSPFPTATPTTPPSPQVLHLLSMAEFFEPENRVTRELKLNYRWGEWVRWQRQETEFGVFWRRSSEWGAYIDRFGLQPVGKPGPERHPDLAQVNLGMMDSIFELWRTAQWKVPKELSDTQKQELKKYLDSDFQQRLSRVVDYVRGGEFNSPWLGSLVGHILRPDVAMDAKTRIQFFEAIWPQIAKRGTNVVNTGTEKIVAQLYTQIGQPGGERKLFSTLGPLPSPKAFSYRPPAKSPAPEWVKRLEPLFQLPPLTKLPPLLQPQITMISFGPRQSVHAVRQLVPDEKRIWIVTSDQQAPAAFGGDADSGNDLQFGKSSLWTISSTDSAPAIFEGPARGKGVGAILREHNRLWITGEGIGHLDLANNQFKRYGLAEGFSRPGTESVAFAGERIFVTASSVELWSHQIGSGTWQSFPKPVGSFSYSSAGAHGLQANDKWLLWLTGNLYLHSFTQNKWTNVTALFLPSEPSAAPPQFTSLTTDSRRGFWLGSSAGLHHLDSQSLSVQTWRAAWRELGVSRPFPPPDFIRSREEAQSWETQFVQNFKSWMSARENLVQRNKANPKTKLSPTQFIHLPGYVSVVCDDGEFVWVATRTSHGDRITLYHAPSDSWVGYFEAPHMVSSLAVLNDELWIGMSGWPHWDLLARVKKEQLLPPRDKWVPDKTDPLEVVQQLPQRQQALYWFYNQDYKRAIKLLGETSRENADLEALFLLGFSCDSLGLNEPARSQDYFREILRRAPETPWSKCAQLALKREADRVAKARYDAEDLKRYDLNHDGVLDDKERAMMAQDPEYLKRMQERSRARLARDFLQNYDADGSGTISEAEFSKAAVDSAMRQPFSTPRPLNVPQPFGAPPQPNAFRFPAPLPPVNEAFSRFDTNKDGQLDVTELEQLLKNLKR